MMIVAVTSDTHGRPFTIPECDVFIHAGDFTAGGSKEETLSFMAWLNSQDQAKYILVVPGNHDKYIYDWMNELRKEYPDSTVLCISRVNILIDRKIVINDKTFWGSPWTTPFFDWFFMATEKELHEIYKPIPQELDVLITHGPPYGILDPGWKESHVGSKALLHATSERRIKHHVFGHLHGAGGKRQSSTFGGTFYNVAACNEAYKLVNQPIIIEL